VGTSAVQGDFRDLVIFSLPGVQSFIEEARSTSDVSAASQIYAALAAKVIESFFSRGDADVVLPDHRVEGRTAASVFVPGIPNRIVVSLPSGSGTQAAGDAAIAADAAWRGWLADVLGTGNVPETPGFPRLQWVCVPAESGSDYASQWTQAQRLQAGRQQVRDFPPVPDEGWRKRELCTLAPRWPAEDKSPSGVPAHERNLKLSGVGWVKHRWHRIHNLDGFPSTASIASAPYRLAVLDNLGNEAVGDAVRRLRDAVSKIPGTAPETPVPALAETRGAGRWLATSGGPWIYPDSWQLDSVAREAGLYRPGRDAEVPADIRQQLEPVIQDGRRAAQDLRDAMPAHAPLARYLAVMVQDLDSMGLFLSGKTRGQDKKAITLSQNEHRRVSRELLNVAEAQRDALCEQALLGVPVYVGGDDLLAFVPASTALEAAQRCHDAVPPSLPFASTAVLFFHYHASIQRAMSEARLLLKEAKKRVEGKHALAVGYLRRSGATAMSIQPWSGRGGASSAVLFRRFARGGAEQLSPRLVTDLERDSGELAALRAENEKRYVAELARLVRRHTNGGKAVTADAVEALDWLGLRERLGGNAGVARPQFAARVGVFLRQEAR
jgi:hypothetical protein